MTEQEKRLLLKDLCARLLNNVKVLKRKPFGCVVSEEEKILEPEDIRDFIENEEVFVFPYLRPMSSMTKNEEKEYRALRVKQRITGDYSLVPDYFNSIHVDYRGLIEKGLALKASEGMYEKN